MQTRIWNRNGVQIHREVLKVHQANRRVHRGVQSKTTPRREEPAVLMQKERGYVTIASAVLLHVSDGTGHTRNVTRKMGSLIGPHDARERGRMQERTTLTWPPCAFLQSTDGPGRFHLYHCTKSPSRCGGRTTVRGSSASDPGVFWTVPSSPAIAARKSTRRLAFVC